VAIVAHRGEDRHTHAQAREPGGDVAGKSPDEPLEGPDLFKGGLGLQGIQVRPDAAQDERLRCQRVSR
jgi:hypothetical protein